MTTRTAAAQIEASRSNGARSHGPATAEGKARAAQNATRHGLRSAHLTPDPADLAALERSVEARFAPADALEAAICRRIAIALWRTRRVDRLEADYWDRPDNADTDRTNEPGLDTILRYQASAANALSKALRDLATLRSGRLDRPNRTNEPEPSPELVRVDPARLADLLAELRGDDLDPFCTNKPEPTPVRTCTNEPEPHLNRRQRRRLAALRG